MSFRALARVVSTDWSSLVRCIVGYAGKVLATFRSEDWSLVQIHASMLVMLVCWCSAKVYIVSYNESRATV